MNNSKKKTIVEQISHPSKLVGLVLRCNKIIIFATKRLQISAKLYTFWVEEEIEDSLAVFFSSWRKLSLLIYNDLPLKIHFYLI